MITYFDYKGKWKQPNSSISFYGTLNFNPENGATLELHGSITENFFKTSIIEIIIGETIEGNITLIDCYPEKIMEASSEVIICTYKPSYIIEGYQFTSKNDISFRNVTFCVLNLFQWLDISGSKKSYFNKSGEISFSYTKPQSIYFEIDEILKGNISFDYQVKGDKIDNKIEFQEQCYVNLNYKCKESLFKIIEDINCFIGFLSLVTYEQSYPISINFQDEDYNHIFSVNPPFKFLNKSIKCFYANSLYHTNRKYIYTNEQLVKYEHIQNIFPIILKNWFEKYSTLEPVFNLLLYTIRNKNKFGVENFMDISRALETFHRRTEVLTEKPNHEYENLVAKILSHDKLDKKELNWLKEKLQYGNEPSLKKRIIGLISKYSNNFTNNKIVFDSKFIQKVVDTRNYYTHFDIKNERKYLKDKELFIASQKLMVLLISCILKDIGLQAHHFESGLNEIFRRVLK